MRIEGKTFLVTGGASGLGAATVEALVSKGAVVVVADRNSDAGAALRQRYGSDIEFIQADVTSEDSIVKALDLAVGLSGTFSGVVSCAGVAPAERIFGRNGIHGLQSFRAAVDVNLVGTFNVLRVAADRLVKRDGTGGEEENGVIINTASVAAYDGQIGQVAYAASKGGVVAMTLPAARELARHSIRVVTIAPGIMETPMLLAMPDEVRASLAATVPFPSRLGKPQEFASLVCHVIENPYLNGEVIRLDGAIRMAAK
ncbi:SDR family NAD(P)-dependent oxidoreductase [Paraburkholderia sp. BL25I1N1]|uniref:SDR family NAD(P)-dependent oxidoreductase n=1 Tax=Paraburkholderia sp. BL25I1N1 TaxID=1938804 RepID=UPI000D07F027|nr:SDR family NAD(P)-dependent oxidoreductase [Paraburkholderia sp. BL25I1N1]PRX89973.1 NAD(P)-dependent dehydrogenase (short-subunit alcohol dehydrogenase family) [Paraburkholderia sp. BL25I1N1]